jgi:hypothetical protein
VERDGEYVNADGSASQALAAGQSLQLLAFRRHPRKYAKLVLNFSERVAFELSDVGAHSKLILIKLQQCHEQSNIQQFVNRLHCFETIDSRET